MCSTITRKLREELLSLANDRALSRHGDLWAKIAISLVSTFLHAIDVMFRIT